MRFALVLAVLSLGAPVWAQPKRILYVTHSAGYRHDSLPVSAQAMRSVAAATGKLEVVATEDVSLLNAANLRNYDAVFFYTSGELPISAQQKQDLLDFVRSGKGFGGAHSATDTFYNWPEYGDLIGAYFNGHPWVQSVQIRVEDPYHPAVAHLTPSFSILDEIYQFRNLSRDRVRVLLSLIPSSVDMNAQGVNPGTDDFPLAWARSFGAGRVFYTALGHFDETWRDAGFQKMLEGAMLWMTGQADGESTPKPRRLPAIARDGVANAASFTPRMTIARGSIISLFGENLTDGASAAAENLRTPQLQLAGTKVLINGRQVPLLYASPTQINLYVPFDTPAFPRPFFSLDLVAGGGATSVSAAEARSTPGIFVVTATRSYASVWATGLGAVEQRGDLSHTIASPMALIGGVASRVQFSGLAPGWLGLYQVNLEIPAGTQFPARLEFGFEGYSAAVTVSLTE